MRNLRQNSRGLAWETEGEKIGRGGGEEKEGRHNPKESSSSSSSCFVHPPPAFSSSEVRAGLLPRNKPTLDHRSLSITNLPKHKSTRSLRSYKTLCPIELDRFHTATDCWRSVWGWICVVDSPVEFFRLREVLSSSCHLKDLLLPFWIQLWVWLNRLHFYIVWHYTCRFRLNSCSLFLQRHAFCLPRCVALLNTPTNQ